MLVDSRLGAVDAEGDDDDCEICNWGGSLTKQEEGNWDRDNTLEIGEDGGFGGLYLVLTPDVEGAGDKGAHNNHIQH